jgi:hypothetical protein
MTQSIERAPNRAPATQGPNLGITLDTVISMTGYTEAELALVIHGMAGTLGCKPHEVELYDVALFTAAAKKLGLEPLLRQVYWIKRAGKGVLQTGIDGYLAIADRTGLLAGVEPIEYRGRKEITYGVYEWRDGAPGQRRQKVKVGEKTTIVPEKATSRVWKVVGQHKSLFVGEALWDEFYPGEVQGDMWHKMPYHMLGKCAKAQAVRNGFPALLGGVTMDASGGSDAPAASGPSTTVEELKTVEHQYTGADYDRYYNAQTLEGDPKPAATPDAGPRPSGGSSTGAPTTAPATPPATQAAPPPQASPAAGLNLDECVHCRGATDENSKIVTGRSGAKAVLCSKCYAEFKAKKEEAKAAQDAPDDRPEEPPLPFEPPRDPHQARHDAEVAASQELVL